MIELKGLTKSYQMGENVLQVLRGIDLRIDEGDFVAIMGPSGSGKSTLMHILGLLDQPQSGSYKWRGREISQLSEDELAVLRREEIGFIFQQFNLLARMSAVENVALPLLYSQGRLTLEKANSLLDRVGLESRSQHRPNELSGGQQQRVAIARSLINSPRLLFADEPTGNLDSVSEKEIMAILRELNAQGITVVIVTHEEEIGAQAKRLIRMRDGQIQSDERKEPLVKTAKSFVSESKTQERMRWLEFLEHFKQGFKILAANKVRTLLSMLGILIGVAAVVAMLALGTGAQKAIEEQLSSLGSNLLILRAGAMRVGGVSQEAGSTTRLTLDDANAIQNQIQNVTNVGPASNGRVQTTFGNKNWNTQVTGITPSYAPMHASDPSLGRFVTEEDLQKRSRVALVGMTVVRELFGSQSPIGEMIKINKVPFQVIGLLPEKGASGPRDQDDMILIPITTAMHRLLGKEYVDSIDIQMQDAKISQATQDAIVDLMVYRHRVPPAAQDQAFNVFNMADVQAAFAKSSQTMATLLAAIATISLIVGGIGIMNIMLVSVTERTREIGLRKAIGARRRDILLQFLVESAAVSAVGGAIGIFLGWLVTFVLGQAAGWAVSVSLFSVLLAFFFSGGIGVVFGLYPARKASALNPIDALRHE